MATRSIASWRERGHAGRFPPLFNVTQFGRRFHPCRPRKMPNEQSIHVRARSRAGLCNSSRLSNVSSRKWGAVMLCSNATSVVSVATLKSLVPRTEQSLNRLAELVIRSSEWRRHEGTFLRTVTSTWRISPTHASPISRFIKCSRGQSFSTLLLRARRAPPGISRKSGAFRRPTLPRECSLWRIPLIPRTMREASLSLMGSLMGFTESPACIFWTVFPKITPDAILGFALLPSNSRRWTTRSLACKWESR